MTYKLEFTEEEMRIVASALSNMPYGQVARLVSKIDSQVVTQSNKTAEVNDSQLNGVNN